MPHPNNYTQPGPLWGPSCNPWQMPTRFAWKSSGLRTRSFFLVSENFVKLRWIRRMREVICDLLENTQTRKHTKSHLKRTQCWLFYCAAQTAETVSDWKAYQIGTQLAPATVLFWRVHFQVPKCVYAHQPRLLGHRLLFNSSYPWRDSAHAHINNLGRVQVPSHLLLS